MSLTRLKDELKTGIDGLDYEHRKFVETIEKLCESFSRNRSALKISNLFGALYAKAAAHFALEERLMREKKYAFYGTHKADHERLLDQIRQIMDAYEDGKCTNCHNRMQACLKAWFAGHVKDADVLLCDLAE